MSVCIHGMNILNILSAKLNLKNTSSYVSQHAFQQAPENVRIQLLVTHVGGDRNRDNRRRVVPVFLSQKSCFYSELFTADALTLLTYFLLTNYDHKQTDHEMSRLLNQLCISLYNYKVLKLSQVIIIQ